MKRVLKFIASIFGDIAGQIFLVIGFILCLGGVFTPMLGMIFAGVLLIAIGGLLFWFTN